MENILCSFEKAFSELDKSKLIQVLSDDPNVNLKILADCHEEEDLIQLIDIGTCSLHVLHSSFKHGEEASKWRLEKSSFMHNIFHESQSRRADYENITNATDTDQFCAHRWIENERVEKRAQLMWEKIVIIVNYWET